MAASSTMDFIYQMGVGILTAPSDGSVTAARLATDAVETAKIKDLNVTAGKLATDAVETAKIKDLNVTAGKLAATQDLSTKTITLPATVAGLGTGIDVTSQITGVVPTANLGSGSASASTYLAGDQSYKTISEYNDAGVRSDIMSLALKQAVQEDMTKHNLPHSAVVVFQADADYDSGGSTDITRNASKYITTIGEIPGAFAWATGDQTSVYTVTEDLTPTTQWPITNWIDGNNSTGSGNAWYFSSVAAIADDWIKFDLGLGNKKAFEGARMYFDVTSRDTGVWKWQGSNNDSDWSDLSSTFTWNDCGSSPCTETWSSSTGYRYIRILGISGNSNTDSWQQELEFNVASISGSDSATGTALGTTNVPTSAVTQVSGVMLMKNAYGTNTLGTDVKVYFTADNSNWTEAASYTDSGTFSDTTKQITLGKTTVTSGSDVRWKIVFANQLSSSKVAEIYGIGTNY